MKIKLLFTGLGFVTASTIIGLLGIYSHIGRASFPTAAVIGLLGLCTLFAGAVYPK